MFGWFGKKHFQAFVESSESDTASEQLFLPLRFQDYDCGKFLKYRFGILSTGDQIIHISRDVIFPDVIRVCLFRRSL